MKTKEAKDKYLGYKISRIPKKDFIVGITQVTTKKGRQDKYENVFIASKENNFYLLYVDTNWFTGPFPNKSRAIGWFRNGGR